MVCPERLGCLICLYDLLGDVSATVSGDRRSPGLQIGNSQRRRKHHSNGQHRSRCGFCNDRAAKPCSNLSALRYAEVMILSVGKT